jgi:hypothetical protein
VEEIENDEKIMSKKTCEVLNWIDLARDKVQWLDLVNMKNNCTFP